MAKENVIAIGGGAGRRGMAAPAGMQVEKGTIKRLLSYLGKYKLRLIFVIICILISSVAGVASSLFMQSLIDDYITPMLL